MAQVASRFVFTKRRIDESPIFSSVRDPPPAAVWAGCRSERNREVLGSPVSDDHSAGKCEVEGRCGGGV